MQFIERLTNVIRNVAAAVTAGALVYGLVVLHQEVKFRVGNAIQIEFRNGIPNFATGELPALLGDRYQIQFWTPSAKTKETPGVKDWLKVDDAMLDAFAETLMNGHIVKGYSRHEVVGAGLGVRKIGEWWSATLNDDVTPEQFLTVYSTFWKPGTDSTYMEIMRVKGGYSQ
jgi:hypothetical protein